MIDRILPDRESAHLLDCDLKDDFIRHCADHATDPLIREMAVMILRDKAPLMTANGS
jgi:hypothetical protein